MFLPAATAADGAAVAGADGVEGAEGVVGVERPRALCMNLRFSVPVESGGISLRVA